MNRKVTVVGGAGNVGATVARGVADKQLADVVIIDIADQKAAGVALDMLVDFAPYVFRGRLAGFLTRLSATGLANVTSGGGQVPAFVVSGR